MRKYYIVSIAVLFIAVSYSLVLNNNQSTKSTESFSIYEENGYYISKHGKIAVDEWQKLDHKDNGFKDVKEFLLDVDYYVDSISEYIGRTDWKSVYKDKHGDDFELKIKFIHTSGEPSHVKGGYNHFKDLMLDIKLNDLFKQNSAPIAHEIAHLIAPPYYSSLSLREGLASFVQDTIGKNPSVFNHGEPIIPMSKKFILEDKAKNNGAIISAVGTEGIPKIMETGAFNIKIRKPFYILSYSFSKYLIDEYGIEKFMKVYETEDIYEEYERIYGKDLEKLRNDWIDYVIEYEEGQ